MNNFPTLDAVPGYNLYIGGFIALRRPKALANCCITHIVSVLDWHLDDQSDLIRGFQHLHIPVDDVEDENLLTWFPRSNTFIEQGLKGANPDNHVETSARNTIDTDRPLPTGPGVLVHCAMGKSRSATIILAYLLWSSRHTYTQSLALYHTTSKDADSDNGAIPIPPKPLTVEEALILLRRGRSLAEPNEGFMEQLYLYYDMGCPDDVQSNKLYKRWMYKRSVKESLSINRAPELIEVRFEDEDPDINEGKEDVGGVAAPDGTMEIDKTDLQIKCRKCRRLLARGQFVADHEPLADSKEQCAHLFLHPLSWMKPALAEGQLDGRLTCPNEKCGANVGKFAWQGLRCSCGGWVTPGFGVARGRVDEVRSRNLQGAGTPGGSGGVRMPPGMGKGGRGNL